MQPPPPVVAQPEQTPPVPDQSPAPSYPPAYQQAPPPQQQAPQPQYQQPGPWQGQQYAPPQQQQPPQYAQQHQPQYGQPQQNQPYPPQYAPGQHTWQPPQKKPVPTWLLMLGVAAAILAVGSALYFGTQKFGKTNPQEKAGLENPANPSKAKVSNPLQKYVEVVGIRLLGDSKKKPIAKFIVVNHSSTEIDGLAATVTLWASTARSEEDSVAAFNFQLPRLGAGESKELTQPVKTKLKLYELPDWQNANADVQITAP